MDSHYTDSHAASDLVTDLTTELVADLATELVTDLATDLGTDLVADDTLIAETHWETRWIAAESTFDPAYERTTAALRRWVDGMEQALVADAGKRRRHARAPR
jgi:hypothetical protein